ncbi:MAG: adenine phosphoribosyltransferase [Lachnospiraceae bacterium]|nr:adenine phosphoribosyltransferase [Lachnospiraceae bacterium]
MKTIKDYIRTIPDFPQKGVMFRDITTVIQDADGLALAIDTMDEMVAGLEYDVIAGAESRGFIFGAPLAYKQHKPFVLIRKKGKLPGKTISQSYDLEYGSTEIEMHTDSFKPGSRVLLVDDLIATGGTTEAMIKLVEKLGGEVAGVCVLIELPDLKGREKIAGYKLFSAVSYEGE